MAVDGRCHLRQAGFSANRVAPIDADGEFFRGRGPSSLLPDGGGLASASAWAGYRKA